MRIIITSGNNNILRKVHEMLIHIFQNLIIIFTYWHPYLHIMICCIFCDQLEILVILKILLVKCFQIISISNTCCPYIFSFQFYMQVSSILLLIFFSFEFRYALKNEKEEDFPITHSFRTCQGLANRLDW